MHRGRLSRFEEADLRLLPLPVLAFACQQAMNALAGRISLPFEAWAWLPLLLSYGLIFLFLWQNRHLKKTCLLVGAGGACNLAVIAANGWRMPVASRAAALLSEQGAARPAGRGDSHVPRRRRVHRLLFWVTSSTAPCRCSAVWPAWATSCWLRASFSA